MSNVLALSGSPSKTSRTAALLRHVGDRIAEEGHAVRHIAVRQLPPGPLLAADVYDPAIRAAVEAIEEADALVIGTPVYKAAYSGLLKSLLDLLPQFALTDKTVLPLATGGTPAHVLALDYALRPVLSSLGTDHILRGWFVLDRQITRDPDGGVTVAPESAEEVGKAVDRLVATLSPAASPASTPAATQQGRNLAVAG